MNLIKKVLPYLVGGLIGSLVVFLIKPNITEEVGEIADRITKSEQEVVISEEQEAERVYCPPAQEPRVIYKVKYKDRIVYVPKDYKPGCHVDDKTGNVIASAPANMDLKCTVDHLSKTVNTKFRQRQAIERLKQLPVKQSIQ